MGKAPKLFSLSDAFWQQEIPQSKFPEWFVKRKVGIACNLVCGTMHILIGIITLSIMSAAVELRTDYDYSSYGHDIKITIPESMAGTVFMHTEIDGVYTTYRTFTSSKDNTIASAASSEFSCTGGETIQDFIHIRGFEFFTSPPSRLVNIDGFFNSEAPIRNTDQGIDNLANTTLELMDVVRHRNSATADWVVLQINPTTGTTIESVRALTSGYIEGSVTTPRPCGLNSYSLLLDDIELRDESGVTLDLDESNTAWDTDVEFIRSTKKGTIAGLHIFPGETDKDRRITLGQEERPHDGPHVLTWLRGSLASDGVKHVDAAFQRLLAWYRNFGGSSFRVFLGKYENIVPGNATLSFKHVDRAWDSWGAERKLVLSTLSAFGSNNAFIYAVCLTIGVIQLAFAALLFFKPKQNTD